MGQREVGHGTSVFSSFPEQNHHHHHRHRTPGQKPLKRAPSCPLRTLPKLHCLPQLLTDSDHRHHRPTHPRFSPLRAHTRPSAPPRVRYRLHFFS